MVFGIGFYLTLRPAESAMVMNWGGFANMAAAYQSDDPFGITNQIVISRSVAGATPPTDD